MYRDSDGYILIDMGAADISKSTQSIVGFYDRIVESVNANKLVLVINFGNYSPMPAIAHKKLNYYVIVTNLYKITINSNDIVIIEETGESTVDVSIVPTLQEGVKIADFAIGEVEGSIYAPEQVDVINDNVTAENTTWSSDKIDTELDKKADSSSLAAVATSGSYADLTNKPDIPSDLDDLSDVTLTAPANGQTLVYDSTSEQFVNATPPSGVTTLSGLSDVSLTTPASGNSLVFDGTEWANDTLDAADIPYSAGVSVADKLDNVPTFNTLTTGDNNKLLGVNVSGGDISVGAVGNVVDIDGSTIFVGHIGNVYTVCFKGCTIANIHANMTPYLTSKMFRFMAWDSTANKPVCVNIGENSIGVIDCNTWTFINNTSTDSIQGGATYIKT